MEIIKSIVNPRGSTQNSRSCAYNINGQVIYAILVWLYDNVDRPLINGYIDETEYQEWLPTIYTLGILTTSVFYIWKSYLKNRLDMNLRAGFQFLSGTRDSPDKNLIIYTYNSIYKICSSGDFNKESAEIVKKLVAQHEVTFKRYFLSVCTLFN